jgi:hypothetical protein
VTSHLSIWMVMTIASVWGNEVSFTSWEKVMGMWDHLVCIMGHSMTT